MQGGCAGAPARRIFNVWLDDFEQKKDENDGEDEAESAATVVTQARSHTITTKTEQQNQDDQKNDHCCLSSPLQEQLTAL